MLVKNVTRPHGNRPLHKTGSYIFNSSILGKTNFYYATFLNKF
ncbi:hypothetical protein E2C01_078772 [Portunus trituberculatus]|uniref:Uncharacterized protein n=1 Tax=Portunus trituberculatus TaxID=210409 RepID=A0A5B7IR43_PORTR|nr:hypothetical protein [Portunus trituberculatus]